jgi:transcriptional regulator with XRE-family HTH domain
MSNWGDRLRDERERLGISQRHLAEIGEVSRPSQTAYEKGGGNPPGDYWNSIAKAGIDIQYVLTGVRSSNWPPTEATKNKQVSKSELIDTLELIMQQTEKGMELVKKMD